MSDLSNNFEEWGKTGPSYSGEGEHVTEWFFDLDDEFTSGKDTAYIDYEKSDTRTAIRRIGEGEEVYINGAELSEVKTGVMLYNTGESYIYNVNFTDIESPDIHGGAFKIGGGWDKATIGITYIKNVMGDGKDVPLSSYSTSNTDFIGIERGSAPVYVQFATAKNFSDGIIDNKSTIYIMNATFEDAYRVLRAHDNSNIVIVNSIINSAPGEALAWLGGPNATISYYNVLWNGEENPDPNLISFSGGLTRSNGMGNVIELSENPLPAISSFFELEIATVAFETSFDGENWTALQNGSFGSSDKALVGDVRFDVDLPSGGTVMVRALVQTTDGDQALTGAMEFGGSDRSVTIDLADFQFGDTGGISDPPSGGGGSDNDPTPPGDGDSGSDTPDADPTGLVAAINVGGGAYTSVETGITYSADPGISSGIVTLRNKSYRQIDGTEDDELYQTYGVGDFSYDIAVPDDGEYLVQIELIEAWFNSDPARIFEVALEGSAFGSFSNINVYDLAGGTYQALTLSETVTVTDGTLDIDINRSAIYNGIVSAITVTALSSGTPATPANTAPVATADAFTLVEDLVLSGVNVLADNGNGADSDPDGDPLNVSLVSNVSNGALDLNSDGSFTYTPNAGFDGQDSFTYRASDGNGGTDNAVVTLTVTPGENGDGGGGSTNTGEPELIAAINVGGGAYTSVESGIAYSADPGISDGTISYDDRSNKRIHNTEDDELYQTFGTGDFSYDIIVPEDGNYLVQIDLIESYYAKDNKRIFDVELEGNAVGSFSDIDIYGSVDWRFTALTLTESVTVTDGVLNIDFDPSLNGAVVSAITVFQEDTLL